MATRRPAAPPFCSISGIHAPILYLFRWNCVNSADMAPVAAKLHISWRYGPIMAPPGASRPRLARFLQALGAARSMLGCGRGGQIEHIL
jgi:hypothetical protein